MAATSSARVPVQPPASIVPARRDRRVRVDESSEIRTPGHHERSLIGFELCGGSPTQDGTERWGEILDVVHVGREHYFLIDSRQWTYGNRRLIPTWAVSTIDLVNRECRTELAAQVMRRAPTSIRSVWPTPGIMAYCKTYSAAHPELGHLRLGSLHAVISLVAPTPPHFDCSWASSLLSGGRHPWLMPPRRER